MFQAIVHAPMLRPGARLCFSDLGQTLFARPERLAVGDDVVIRFGTCCPSHGAGAVVAVGSGTVVLGVEEACWRLRRCPAGGGVDIPGLIGEDWFVVERSR